VPTFEQGFSELENAAGDLVRSTAALLAVAKQVQKAAVDGDIGRLRRQIERLEAGSTMLRREVSNVGAAWAFSPDAEEQHLRDGYRDELLSAAREQGLQLHERDQRLIAFPSIVRILPAERAVRIDRRKVASIRPARLVSLLKANQEKKPRFSPERFLEALYRAFQLLTEKKDVVKMARLVDIYEVFTLQPGGGSEYDKTDFARDLLLLERSGVRQTRSGAELRFAAATGTRGGKVIRIADPEGHERTYYAIAFSESGQ
jgi:hypothetical protein